ncbi:MAG: glycosyltransferase family 39 protein [Candidatus Dormibacteraeota bacterium]|nr:glycosyltransferase family 39 protein [Candidatus Dormibacteraeota bacterium]
MKKGWALALTLAAIVTVGLVLRLHGYTQSPAPGDNYDGLGWAWQGQSLILTHVPQAWSWLPSYHPTAYVHKPPITLPVVSPYFDHPPLFALMVGGAAVLAGERTPADISDSVIRLVPIALSLVTILLTYALVVRLSGRGVALVAAAALAVSPPIVLTSRLVESEALLTPLLLAAVLLSLRIGAGAGRRWVIALAAVCAASLLTKEVGAAVGLASAAVLLLSPRRRLAWVPLAGLAAGVAIYLLYAYAIDWHQFEATVMALGTRRGPFWGAVRGYFTSTTAGLGILVPLVDPVWYLGWLVLAALALLRREWRPVALAALVYATLVVSLGSGVWMYWIGWYRIPDEPFLYAAVVTAALAVLSTLRAALSAADRRRRPAAA